MRPSLLALLLALSSCGAAAAQSNQEWVNLKRSCGLPQNLAYNVWVSQGSPCPARNAGGGNTNNGAAAAAAADAQRERDAEAQRQRDAELEQQRIEVENQRRAEELQKQIKFEHGKQEALGQLKGVAGGAELDSSLKGISNAESGLKADLGNGLKTLPDVNTDPMVVDARNVPTGLPKSVEAQIPDTPAGQRVRRGFECAMDHNWPAALAWFKDALNHEPGNAGLARLVDLAQFTIDRANSPHPAAPSGKPAASMPPRDQAALANAGKQLDDKMDANLDRALDDFVRNYLPKHPELQQPWKAPPAATQASPAHKTITVPPPDLSAAPNSDWKAFFSSLFTRSHRVHVPPSVAGVRG